MKTLPIYLLSHVAVGLVAAVTVWTATYSVSSIPLQLVALLPVTLCAAVVGLVIAQRIHGAHQSFQQLLSGNEPPDRVRCPYFEFEDTFRQLQASASRWYQITAHAREESRELIRLASQLGSPPPDRSTNIALHLRQILGQTVRTTEASLGRMLTSTHEIEKSTRDIASGSEDQSEAVSRTTTYAEQMSINVDAIASHATAARDAVVDTRDASAACLNLIEELSDGMSEIRQSVEAGGRKLRSLGEQSNTISSIVETIGAISSRTDMLALNASIESVRAGEHGRGFAFVAEEVRKLAEQAANATQEVAGLVESIRLETQDSIHMMTEEHNQLEAEIERIIKATKAVEHIHTVSRASADRVEEITGATQHQLQLIRDLVVAVERISKVAKTSRSRADNAQWNTQTLMRSAEEVNASINPLRSPEHRAHASEPAVEPSPAPARAELATTAS